MSSFSLFRMGEDILLFLEALKLTTLRGLFLSIPVPNQECTPRVCYITLTDLLRVAYNIGYR